MESIKIDLRLRLKDLEFFYCWSDYFSNENQFSERNCLFKELICLPCTDTLQSSLRTFIERHEDSVPSKFSSKEAFNDGNKCNSYSGENAGSIAETFSVLSIGGEMEKKFNFSHSLPPSATKAISNIRYTLTNFRRDKVNILTSMYKTFNEKVFLGTLPTSLSIKWSSRLLTTAGITRLARRSGERFASIEISTKVSTMLFF